MFAVSLLVLFTMFPDCHVLSFFFFNDTATTEIYTLSLHDALPIAAQGSARTVRVQVVTPPGVLSRAGQKQLVAEVTEILARISGDPSQAGRTWVLLTEAAEGGWGIAGTAFGKEEFAALAAKKK